MGQAESSPQDGALTTGIAYHVLRVAENSPCSASGIEPYFDFVCAVNGHPLVSRRTALVPPRELS